VEYRPAAKDGPWQARNVGISSDPSGRYQLFSYIVRVGGRSVWIDGETPRFLPVERPSPGALVTAW
jgi:hypothetical protein